MQADPKFRREHLRWLILLTLNRARPLGAAETVLLAVARAEFPDATQLEIRQEMDYLQERELIEVAQPGNEEALMSAWRAKLTRHGVDVAEYTVPVEPGIARPIKYW